MSLVRRIGNAVVSSVLRSRAHRLLSGSLILIGFRGRRTGREYTIPVAYAEDDEGLIVFAAHAAGKNWWRSMRDAPVRVRLRGVEYDGIGHVVRDPAFAPRYLAGNPRAAGALAAEPEPVFVRLDHLRPHREAVGGRTRRAP